MRIDIENSRCYPSGYKMRIGLTQLEVQLIRVIRKSGMSQNKLAKLSGVTQGALSRFLSKDATTHRSLSLSTADRLCRTLKLKLVRTKSEANTERSNSP